MENNEMKEKCVNCEEAIKNEPKEVGEGQQLADKPYQSIIEEARIALYKDYAKTKKISNIMMFVVVALLASTMFMIVSQNKTLQIIGYVAVGLLVVGLGVYYFLNRKKFPDKTKSYVDLVVRNLNSRMFADKHFAEMEYNREKKLELAELLGDGIYAEAVNINSRNVISGVFKGQNFTYAEAALIRTTNRKKPLPPLFVGHYITMVNNLEFDGRFVVVFKNIQEPVDLPNAVGDLVVLEEKENLVIYGLEGSEYQKVLKDNLVKKLSKVAVTHHLLNINIAFWGGRSVAYLSYDDAVMSVPFDKPFNAEGFENACDNLGAVLEAFAGK